MRLVSSTECMCPSFVKAYYAQHTLKHARAWAQFKVLNRSKRFSREGPATGTPQR